MVTKWKNRLLMVLWVILLLFGLSGIFVFSTLGTDYMERDYFATSEFRSELHRFTDLLFVFDINNVSYDDAVENITVSEEEIDEHRYRFGGLEEQVQSIYERYENRIEEMYAVDNEEAANALMEERDGLIEDITLNFSSDSHVREKVEKEKEERLKAYYRDLERIRPDFEKYLEQLYYYFEDMETGKAYTNVDGARAEQGESIEDLLFNDQMLYVTDFTFYSDAFLHKQNFIQAEMVTLDLDGAMVEEYNTSWFEGQIAVPHGLTIAESPIMDAYEKYKNEQRTVWIYIFSSVVALIFCGVIGKISKGVSEELRKWENRYNWLPIDVRVILFIGFTGIPAFILFILGVTAFSNSYENIIRIMYEIVLITVLASLFLALIIAQFLFLWRAVTSWAHLKKELGRSLTVRFLNRLKKPVKRGMENLQAMFLNQSVGIQLSLVMVLIFVLGFAGVMLFMHEFLAFIYLLILAGLGFPLATVVVKKIGYFNQIVEKSNEIASGKLGSDLPVEGKSVLANLAENINVLKDGFRISQSEQAKSERLKTELITNVSHDLRTPLTSIITYTQLLKSGEVAVEDQSAYLEIIDRKSKRLKVLIDDLFEVSKMASGNIELTKSRVDLVQLLQQALGEYDDTMKESSLQFRISKPDEPMYAYVDGQKLWRVFDNLIGNILKYSLENSRVYISIGRQDSDSGKGGAHSEGASVHGQSYGHGSGVMTFKNVSKYEMNDDQEELFERFKRGDESRNTEGSGLGLAIAKSIVDLHGGSLEIETDGDLFKATITLSLDK
ncbi:sensor histidine kinase [Evansella tamaricis]|uniref:histidine kinase n=1 Tax=Evansella tamaricis TaxID=2069301 RepID=A0ABS6JCY3_9BACI|nr:HAMP domain-containing sensor histidine kinase [Evansella tamaricis]MBU9710213.1 HAMP domain-containing histidine kinase [Evansella tamaricis]